MRLKWKILFGFLTLAAMLLVAGIWSIYALDSIGASVQRLLDENYKSINAADRMQEALERQDSGVLLVLLGRWEEGRNILNSGDQAFRQAYAVAQNNLTISDELQYVERIGIAYEHYRQQWQEPIVDASRERNITWYFTEVHSVFQEVKERVSELKRLNEKSLYETASDLKNRAERAVVPGTVATVAALVFSILFSYLVSRFMVGPITRITASIEAFVETRRPFDVQVETGDEIGTLALAVSKLCLDSSNSRKR